MCPLYVLFVSFICPLCVLWMSLCVLYVSFVCPLCVLHMSFMCPLYVLYVSFECLYVSFICPLCVLYVLYVSFICPLCVFYMSFMCPLCVLYMSFTVSKLLPVVIRRTKTPNKWSTVFIYCLSSCLRTDLQFCNLFIIASKKLSFQNQIKLETSHTLEHVSPHNRRQTRTFLHYVFFSSFPSGHCKFIPVTVLRQNFLYILCAGVYIHICICTSCPSTTGQPVTNQTLSLASLQSLTCTLYLTH